MADDDSRAGGCLCGAVRYEVRGEPFWVGHCHCRKCRRQTGAAMATLAAFDAGRVSFVLGERRIHESSPGVGRGFCGACGTPLTWEGSADGRGPIVEVHIGTLDDPAAFTPESHSWYSQRVPWFDVADGLPRHRGFDFDGAVVRIGPATGGLPG